MEEKIGDRIERRYYTKVMNERERDAFAKWASTKEDNLLKSYAARFREEIDEFSRKRTNSFLAMAIVEAELRKRRQ
jgi:hypothetical protein